jgi:hypothetical protein
MVFTRQRQEDVWRPGLFIPTSAYAVSAVTAALLVAVPLTGIYWMAAGAESRLLRWLGYAALAVLAFMTLYWPSIPRDLP